MSRPKLSGHNKGSIPEYNMLLIWNPAAWTKMIKEYIIWNLYGTSIYQND